MSKQKSDPLAQFRDEETGKLQAYAWPGGYPIYYLDGDNSTLCAKCANESEASQDEIDSFKPVGGGVYYEGETLLCANCNAEIESAYGDPNDAAT